MEEDLQKEEQPIIQPSMEGEGSSNEPAEDVEPEKVEAERGVPIGKFKNAEELLKAYNNLEAEFTKKSQKLSSLLKDKAEEKPSAEEALKSFLSKNQEAAVYVEELQGRIDGQGNIDEAAYQRAWEGLLYEKLSSKSRANEPFVQNLLKDDNIQQLVIKDYLKALAAKQAPVVMASQNGERITKPVQEKPDTFDAAKKVVMQMLS